MPGPNDRQPRGFKGLPALASDVSAGLSGAAKAAAAGMASEWPDKFESEDWAYRVLQGLPPRGQRSAASGIGSFLAQILSTKFGFFMIIGCLFWVCEAVTSKPSSTTYRGAGLPSAGVSVPSASSASYPTAPYVPSSPAVDDAVEDKPPVGEGLRLSTAQVRYCVFESARIEKMQRLVTSNVEVANTNRFIEDYNRRCGRYRYTTGTLEYVRRQAAQRDTELTAEARRRL